MATASSSTSRSRRLWLSTAGVLTAAVAFFAALRNQAAIDSRLLRAFGPIPNPVFDTPLLDLTLQHLAIVLVSSALTIAVGLPLGIWVTRDGGRDFRDIVSVGVDFGQVFPPIAVLALMFPLLGLSPASAVLALFLYGLLPVVSSTVAGLESVSPAIIDAARGMGLGHWRILFAVELPLASAVILGGIRTSVVINVGTATVAAAVGAGGLGLPIFTGINTGNTGYIFEGAVTVSLLALLLDSAVATTGLLLEPEGLT